MVERQMMEINDFMCWRQENLAKLAFDLLKENESLRLEVNGLKSSIIRFAECHAGLPDTATVMNPTVQAGLVIAKDD